MQDLFHRLMGRVLIGMRDERGDVPGWVLITLMTAALVVAIWVFASPLLQRMFEDAMGSVTFGAG